METVEEDDDLKLVKASAGLLTDLENAVPKLLWRPASNGSRRQRVHTQVKREDLEHVLRLIEPFQGDPQLLDAKLKTILPPISDAYTSYLLLNPKKAPSKHLDLQLAICCIIYTLCKVRGYKVVVGFLNNEPRYLQPVLKQVEETLSTLKHDNGEWQTPYVLLLWLSHLLLTPFDLSSIYGSSEYHVELSADLRVQDSLPPIARSTLAVALAYLSSSTKAQDAAAKLLVRLVERPDMQSLRLADSLVAYTIDSLQSQKLDASATSYRSIGPLRFLAGIARTSELGHLIPNIYRICLESSGTEDAPIITNAVAKKITVKIFRNIVITSLKTTSASTPLAEFCESSGVVEEAIDYLLRSLGDRDNPVRYGAAKALSMIISELDAEMGYEVIQAILQALKDDIPHIIGSTDYRNANPLRWHGLILALSHTLFKRSASPDQLPDIVTSLALALQFEQRTATGSSVGTNVRDAANFGIWSLSRRYTTQELLSVDASDLGSLSGHVQSPSVIQYLANQLLLAACLDPAGNIRRGSSAALQELIGRHPNQVYEGINLVQIVDYQAVGLRRRAMLDVAGSAAKLHQTYWEALANALLRWRGIESTDVLSREAAAASLSRLGSTSRSSHSTVLEDVLAQLLDTLPSATEHLHGLTLTLAFLLQSALESSSKSELTGISLDILDTSDLHSILRILLSADKDFSARSLRSEVPIATAKMLAAYCRLLTADQQHTTTEALECIDELTERIFLRFDDTVLQAIPLLAHSLFALKRSNALSPGALDLEHLARSISTDGSKSSLHGAGRAMALGALIHPFTDGPTNGGDSTAVSTLCALVDVANVEWRVVGIKATQLTVESQEGHIALDPSIASIVIQAVHRGMNDYTIDERGDIGSLVRLQAISCASTIFASDAFRSHSDLLQVLQADILRLSLEKLDRVRLTAAECQCRHLGFQMPVVDVAATSSDLYFEWKFSLLAVPDVVWKHAAVLEGAMSCAGISAEPLLQASRSALVQQLNSLAIDQLQHQVTIFADVLRVTMPVNKITHPALELLAFLLDMYIPQRIAGTDFKWRTLLSTVQKSHHKSNDIPKILAAVHVYRGLAEIPSLRSEVLKKLSSMLRTNPYPKVRLRVAECLYILIEDPNLLDRDWLRPTAQHTEILQEMQKQYLNG